VQALTAQSPPQSATSSVRDQSVCLKSTGALSDFCTKYLRDLRAGPKSPACIDACSGNPFGPLRFAPHANDAAPLWVARFHASADADRETGWKSSFHRSTRPLNASSDALPQIPSAGSGKRFAFVLVQGMPSATLWDGYGRRCGGGALHSCSRLVLSTSLWSISKALRNRLDD
jgi:hypothetical protein